MWLSVILERKKGKREIEKERKRKGKEGKDE